MGQYCVEPVHSALVYDQREIFRVAQSPAAANPLESGISDQPRSTAHAPPLSFYSYGVAMVILDQNITLSIARDDAPEDRRAGGAATKGSQNSFCFLDIDILEVHCTLERMGERGDERVA